MRFRLSYRETILTVMCGDGLREEAFDAVLEARYAIESKIDEDPFFGITYDPYPPSRGDHDLVRRMCRASLVAGVGPMAGVAGAVAAHVAERLLSSGSPYAVVENGGDIAFCSPEPRLVGIFADHPVFRDLAFNVSSDRIVGICSSSRTVGPSVSLGASSISTVFSDDVVLADCCATALGNRVTDEGSLQGALERIGALPGVRGCMACCGDRVAMYGDLPEVVPADCSGSVPRAIPRSGSICAVDSSPMDWTKISVGISLIWLIILFFRLAVYSAPFASTPQGELFVTVLNVFLVIGIVVVGYSLFRSLLRFTVAKTMKDTHCPQCYSKVDRGAEFCPFCGRELRRRRLHR